MRLDKLAEILQKRWLSALKQEEELAAARLLTNAWALGKSAWSVSVAALSTWFRILLPLITWSAVLEYFIWAATPGLKVAITVAALGLWLYASVAVARMGRQLAYPRHTLEHLADANFGLKENQLHLPRYPHRNKGRFGGTLAGIVRRIGKLFANARPNSLGTFLYRVLVIGGAVTLTVHMLISPETGIATTYFGQLNVWQFKQLLAVIGYTPSDMAAFFADLDLIQDSPAAVVPGR